MKEDRPKGLKGRGAEHSAFISMSYTSPNYDDLVKTLKAVTPAEAGVQNVRPA